MAQGNPVVHFEMPYEDLDRVSAFYREAFGWGMQPTGPDMGDYILAATAETGADGRPTAPGTINGGFYPRRPDAPAHPSVVIAVADIEAAARGVADGGGEVLGDPIEIPGIGRYVSFHDPEGNRVSLLQPST